MFLGILLGALLWSIMTVIGHGEVSARHQRNILAMDPRIHSTIRLYGLMRVSALLVFWTSLLGAIGWIIEVSV